MLSSGRFRLSPATGAAGGQGHSQFYSIGFYGHNAAFFDSFLGSKKESSPRSHSYLPRTIKKQKVIFAC